MNTAGRLLSTFESLLKHRLGNDAVMLKIWAEVFELSSGTPHLEDAVVMCLQATRSEIEALRVRLQSLGVPESLMHTGITRLRNYTSTTNINTQWRVFREEATKPENLLTFRWATWTLRNEDEEDMTTEDLTVLREELESLEQSLRDTEIEPYLQDFIQRQIDTIRTALRIYRVQGLKPIEEALRKVAGAYTIEKTRVETEQAKASKSAKIIFARTGAIIKKTAETADNLNKIGKTCERAYTLAATVGPLLMSYGQNIMK